MQIGILEQLRSTTIPSPRGRLLRLEVREEVLDIFALAPRIEELVLRKNPRLEGIAFGASVLF